MEGGGDGGGVTEWERASDRRAEKDDGKEGRGGKGGAEKSVMA